ncbi:MAG: T9SS type A sorting domain-containing protein, partial [Candidatus Marinimicrobia bacterium]|nr:T9SS type A sorting domain-containing protein [Candidatus Neomarinimicrobiota bacterium]
NDGDTCDGNEDCFGDCGGTAYLDDCGVCDSNTNNDNEQCLDCNSVPNGDSVLDNCGTCDNNVSNDCVMDCNGVWGGSDFVDDCGICEGPQIDGDLDGDGDICETACTEALDCFGVCGGEAFTDDCGLCVGGATDSCIPDCLGIPGGTAYLDDCNTCDADSENDNQCVDCNGTVDGAAILDNCGNCVEDLSDSSYECEQDCNGVWGGEHPPTFSCQNGKIACNYNACFDLAYNEFQLPQRFDINRIYPNPFNPQATIDFGISEPAMVQLNIYNLNGQKVDILKNAFTLPGNYSVIWNGTNHPSGIYFVILQSSNAIVKQKMMLIK